MTTEDGTALKDAVTIEVENEAYSELQEEYDWCLSTFFTLFQKLILFHVK